MPRGMYDGWLALRDGLRTMVPPLYWFDYGSRVFSVLASPEMMPELPDFYLCIPFDGETERFEEQAQHSVKAYWQQKIFAFARDKSDIPLESDGLELIAKIRDDLTRFFLANPTLSGAVQEIALIGTEREAAFDLDHSYAELVFRIEVLQFVDSSALGPAAS